MPAMLPTIGKWPRYDEFRREFSPLSRNFVAIPILTAL
jgi:hypothetical protein